MQIKIKTKRRETVIDTKDTVVEYDEDTRTVTLHPSKTVHVITPSSSCFVVNNKGTVILAVLEVRK